jgi:hypothetical protein
MLTEQGLPCPATSAVPNGRAHRLVSPCICLLPAKWANVFRSVAHRRTSLSSSVARDSSQEGLDEVAPRCFLLRACTSADGSVAPANTSACFPRSPWRRPRAGSADGRGALAVARLAIAHLHAHIAAARADAPGGVSDLGVRTGYGHGQTNVPWHIHRASLLASIDSTASAAETLRDCAESARDVSTIGSRAPSTRPAQSPPPT